MSVRIRHRVMCTKGVHLASENNAGISYTLTVMGLCHLGLGLNFWAKLMKILNMFATLVLVLIF